MVREHVEAGAALFTDELKSYDGLDSEYTHAVINHVSNTRTAMSTRTRWTIFGHCSSAGCMVLMQVSNLFIYFDTWTSRPSGINNRKATDVERFNAALRQIAGRRLTYEEVTGNSEWRLGQSPASA